MPDLALRDFGPIVVSALVSKGAYEGFWDVPLTLPMEPAQDRSAHVSALWGEVVSKISEAWLGA